MRVCDLGTFFNKTIDFIYNKVQKMGNFYGILVLIFFACLSILSAQQPVVHLASSSELAR